MVDSKPQAPNSNHNPPSRINNCLSPGPAPCRELLLLAQRRCAFPESPTSPCQHGFHPARCGRACGNLCRPPAAHRTEVAAPAVLPPKCIGNCCQSLRSTSLGLSIQPGSKSNYCRTSNFTNTANFLARPARCYLRLSTPGRASLK